MTGVATAAASTATARVAQPSDESVTPRDDGSRPPGAVAMAACWAAATRAASDGEIGRGLPVAEEKKDSNAT